MNPKKYLSISLLSFFTIVLCLYFSDLYFLSQKSVSHNIIFTHPNYLFGLWGIPALYLIFYYHHLRKVKFFQHFGSPSNHKKIKLWRIVTSQFLWVISFSSIIIALAQPIYGKKKVKGVSKSMEIVFCLDISNSMNALDMEGESRLEVAKRTMKGMIHQLSGEKVGLCLFAGDAIEQLPLTSDYATAEVFIEDVQTSLMSEQGTNVVSALEKGSLMLSKNNEPKCIILISDGENHEQKESEVFNFIRENGIHFFGIGIGTSAGAPIPVDPLYPETGNKRDEHGFTILSKSNGRFVKELASKMNGTAIITSQAYPDLNAILTEINHAKTTNSRNLEFEIKSSVYEYPVMLALISMFLWFLIDGIRAYD